MRDQVREPFQRDDIPVLDEPADCFGKGDDLGHRR
jgi:hypothetical protein